MRRPLALFACLTVLLGAASVAGAAERWSASAWASADIRLVVSRGLMARDVGTFRPDDPLTLGELNALVAGLQSKPAVAAATASGAPVSLTQLDARLVATLGLSGTASAFLSGARAAGLTPPARFGTETVARLLGLRFNHPHGTDNLELAPTDPVTRAETAYSAARVLRFSGWETAAARDAATTFVLPELTAWQQRVLNTAVKLIGYPYVWGGTTELAQAPLGTEVKGGFDCSGFVWRVYRGQQYAGGARLAKVLRGRTAAAMAGEVTAARRIPLARLAPGDLLFFAPGGPRARPAAVDHMGIYVGSGWLIHSSRYGVALAQVTNGWYRDRLAWGRRPLAEAGLV
ncbi:MAG: C40 family peptidase [Gaiellaceae bacterium]